ncbi:Pimeloyl-ACP methyl ester carboxylesterase [Kriegella aquimaris]|uniref:Pimeloyl-ACP methyl ester carboxylesterase n=2 Tax=Kriegella aquimaris TaxID=192904 RepID=A0A1G9W1Y2_9FLAO|nr:Pimeloyl-ACP methyl ester carboxylesterase [Kriegella aquimaris]
MPQAPSMKKLISTYSPLVYGKYFNALSRLSKEYAAKKAFQTFSKVRKGRVLPEQTAFLNRARMAVEKVADHQLQSYLWRGSKETVLLVHGWESNSFRWHKLIEFLQREDYNIIAFDAPGHGHSSGKRLHVPLYTICLHHMVEKYKPNYIAAHSVGGMTTLYHQYKHPISSIEKIATIGSPSEYHEIMEHYQKLLNLNDTVMEALNQHFKEHFGFTIQEFSTSKFVKTNTKKGLLFHDKFDNITPFHASEAVHANWKGSTLIATEGLGHSMHQDEVNQQIISFFNGLNKTAKQEVLF